MTDVIEEIGNLDFEVGIARHVKTLAHLIVGPMLLVSKLHTATALGNIHVLRRLGRKTVAAGQHHAQRLHLARRRNNRAAGDLAIVINVGLLFDVDVLEAHFFLFLLAAMRKRSAFSLMKPSASFWLYAPLSSSKVAMVGSNNESRSGLRPTTTTLPL